MFKVLDILPELMRHHRMTRVTGAQQLSVVTVHTLQGLVD